jgi:hypothetical protein
MDVFVDPTGPGAASLWQTNPANVNDDGDLFWQGSNFGQGNNGYNGTGQFTAGAWHRVAAAYNMAANPPVVVKYVDGIFQDNWTANQGLDNPRRALQPTALLFADGDRDERRVMYVNSVQIRAGAVSAEALAALGGPDAAGIPIELPSLEAPALCFGQGTSSIGLAWPRETTGWALESSTGLTGWAPVQGVVNNAVEIPITQASPPQRLFRLKRAQ